MDDKERYLECLVPSNLMHFEGNFIKGKKYKVEDYGGTPCIEAENGVQYPVNERLNELVDMDLTFELKPMFI